jgi:Ca2+-binding RTX toxin-like protein
MEEIIGSDFSIVGRLFYTATGAGEVSRATIAFAPGNRVTINDAVGIEPSGLCAHPNPADRTIVVCDGGDAVGYNPAHVNVGAGNDRVVVLGIGGARPSTEIQSGPGNDSITGGPGSDTIYDAAGSDIQRGGAGKDFLYGQFGNDRLLGGLGNDRLEGGFGRDRLYGGLGNDTVNGGPGNDLLFTGPGRDTATGGGGLDFLDGRRD